MSSITETKKTVEEADVCCASCGIAAIDDIKLKQCNGGCDLVRYCSDKCQGNHREQHEEECKQRKAELRDKELFEQPDISHWGECPICFIPIPIDPRKSTFCSCCCKIACIGCSYANFKSSGRWICPFCREPAVNGKKENYKRMMKRVKVNDPGALFEMGIRRNEDGDFDKGFEYLKEAAELGDAAAHYQLGHMYYKGEGVEEDLEKAIPHWEDAAIGGHPMARHNLGVYEGNSGNTERAVKHYIIAAKLGYEESMTMLWKFYSDGRITKQDLEDTLRTHKAAIDATKNSQREEAVVYFQQLASSAQL